MNYATLQAGPELDALIAEKVMGWKPNAKHPNLSGDGWWETENGGENGYLAVLPEFSTDIAAAWTVVEKMPRVLGHIYPSFDEESGKFLHWCAVVENSEPWSSARYGAVGETAPLAICRAALRAAVIDPAPPHG